jgi:hypothetical protein
VAFCISTPDDALEALGATAKPDEILARAFPDAEIS